MLFAVQVQLEDDPMSGVDQLTLAIGGQDGADGLCRPMADQNRMAESLEELPVQMDRGPRGNVDQDRSLEVDGGAPSNSYQKSPRGARMLTRAKGPWPMYRPSVQSSSISRWAAAES